MACVVSNCCRAAAATSPIDLLLRGFCRAGVDNVIICPPTFGMYAVAARIQGAVREVPLRTDSGFALDADAVSWPPCDANTRIVFLCSPNNPTGNAMDPAAILRLLQALAGRALVGVDEAYIEFSGDPSLSGELAKYCAPGGVAHLLIPRPMAWPHGGSLIACAEIVALLAKVIPPYSIPQLTIEAVLATLAPPQLAIQHANGSPRFAWNASESSAALASTAESTASGPASSSPNEQIDAIKKIRFMPGVFWACARRRRLDFSWPWSPTRVVRAAQPFRRRIFRCAAWLSDDTFSYQGVDFDAVFVCPHRKGEQLRLPQSRGSNWWKVYVRDRTMSISPPAS